MKKVAVIGAGAAGLACLRVLSRVPNLTVVAFEKSAAGCGGVWNYKGNSKEATDNPMYCTMRTNLPKEIMAFPGAPFPVSSGSGSGSFVTHKEVQEYLESYADEHGLHRMIRYSTEVTSVSPTHAPARGSGSHTCESHWTLTSAAATGSSSSSSSETFDYIVVANGHCSARNFPTPADLGTDTGTNMAAYQRHPAHVVLHSGDYDGPHMRKRNRTARGNDNGNCSGNDNGRRDSGNSGGGDEGSAGLFADKSVLVVGGRNSATDLAREISAVASVVHCSDRNANTNANAASVGANVSGSSGGGGTDVGSCGGTDEHGNLRHYPGIRTYHEDTREVELQCGSRVKADVLIWCTGFQYEFPFLGDSFGHVGGVGGEAESMTTAVAPSGRRVQGLYQQLWSVREPSLSFVGLPFAVVPFPLFTVQAMAIASAIRGRSELPSLTERQQWLQSWEPQLADRGCLNDSKYHYLGEGGEQWEYSHSLLRSAFPSRDTAADAAAAAAADVGTDGEEEERANERAELAALTAHLRMCEQIYNENRKRKPACVGYSDTYRDVQYAILGTASSCSGSGSGSGSGRNVSDSGSGSGEETAARSWTMQE